MKNARYAWYSAKDNRIVFLRRYYHDSLIEMRRLFKESGLLNKAVIYLGPL